MTSYTTLPACKTFSYECYKEDVVLIECLKVEGYSRMCNNAWKNVIGRWFMPRSVFRKYHILMKEMKEMKVE